MGTPDFAVPSLEILYNAGYQIVGVITAVDKKGGRGRKTLLESAIKKYAQSKSLTIFQPTNLKSPKFQAELKQLNADIQIVVAFRMLPQAVWDMPPMGTYNLHGSLLPAYRGAAPINWAIINGEKQTGVTFFKLKHEIDTGNILLTKKVTIYNDDKAGDLHDRMMWVAADAVYDSIKRLEEGTVELEEQDDSSVSHAPKLHNENTEINFDQAVSKVYDFVRGLSPYPVAWTSFDNKRAKIRTASIDMSQPDKAPGSVETDNKNFLKFACADGYLVVEEIQLSGKKNMKTKAFLNGYGDVK